MNKLDEFDFICEKTDKDEIIKARQFCADVKSLAKKYKLPFFIVTEGASAYSNNGCEPIRLARQHHSEWERKNGFDPDHDWNNDIKSGL